MSKQKRLRSISLLSLIVGGMALVSACSDAGGSQPGADEGDARVDGSVAVDADSSTAPDGDVTPDAAVGPAPYDACPTLGDCPGGDCLLDLCFVDCSADGTCPEGLECADGYYCLRTCMNGGGCGAGGCCWGGHCMPVSVCASTAEGASCLGHCGDPAPSGCQCNASCTLYADCCDDRDAVCSATGSCVGACGGQSPDGCWCDPGCAGFGNCCPDYAVACP